MKAVAVIILVAIIGGAGWWLSSRGEKAPSTETITEQSSATNNETEADTNDPQNVIVTYTDSGFSPPTVTVNVGDSVVFKNESSRLFQPASDPHPVHTNLSGFDAKTGVAPGQSYTFSFNKTGTWGFHNHLDSDKIGKVIVR